jgi:hypothetical protein
MLRDPVAEFRGVVFDADQVEPAEYRGLSWTQVAVAMRDPASPVARTIDGAANVIAAAICTLTHGRPGGVCRSAGVTAAAGSP